MSSSLDWDDDIGEETSLERSMQKMIRSFIWEGRGKRKERVREIGGGG